MVLFIASRIKPTPIKYPAIVPNMVIIKSMSICIATSYIV